MGSWLNILDPAFNLHLREDHVAQAWLVKKPTTDGIVTSIELFDQHQQPIALFFGKRKPAQPELTSWRNLLQELEDAKKEVEEEEKKKKEKKEEKR